MNSNLEAELDRYLSLRSSMGQRTDEIGPRLKSLVKHLGAKSEMPATISVHDILSWVCAGKCSTSTKHVRLSAARVFLKHLRVFQPELVVPGANLIEPVQRRQPFVFSVMQLHILLDCARRASANISITPVTLRTMLGLMSCTGLRPGEVIRLQTSQVLLDAPQPRLLIVETKFKKTRWVPLHETVVLQLQNYLEHRKILAVTSNFFFVTKKGQRINRITFHGIFQRLIASSGIQPHEHQLPPTPQSLRHTFAVHRLMRWYDEGADLTLLVPNLSVYLGHVNPASSYWYMTCTPELMAAASARFENYATRQKERSHET